MDKYKSTTKTIPPARKKNHNPSIGLPLRKRLHRDCWESRITSSAANIRYDGETKEAKSWI